MGPFDHYADGFAVPLNAGSGSSDKHRYRDNGRQPITRARSEWTEGKPMVIAGVTERVLTRFVNDGRLTVIVGLEPEGWHLSISFSDHRGQPSRYPRWDEIADARYQLVPDEITMAMILPPPDDYVAVHDTTFHLHEIPA